jgi:DNA-binding CsgD family transcriptional regulator
MDVQAAVIGDLYAAGVREGSWHDALRQARRFVGAPSAMLFTPFVAERDGGLVVVDGVPVEVATRYFAEVAAVDVWYHELLRRNGGRLPTGLQWNTDELITTPALRRTRLHADYLRQTDLGGACGLMINGGEDPAVPTAAVTFYRSLQSSPFEDEIGVRVGQLAVHFRRAFAIWQRLRSCTSAGVLAAQQASLAAVVLARDRRILFANPAAERLLADPALGLARQGRLCAGKSAELVALETALGVCQARRFAAPARPPRLLVRLQGGPNEGVVARIVPCPAAVHGPSAAAVVFISREGRARLDVRELMAVLYKLTPAEALLVDALCQGQQLQAFADCRGVSMTTVRTQLRGVFAKTGTKGQSDLMKLVFSVAQ